MLLRSMLLAQRLKHTVEGLGKCYPVGGVVGNSRTSIRGQTGKFQVDLNVLFENIILPSNLIWPEEEFKILMTSFKTFFLLPKLTLSSVPNFSLALVWSCNLSLEFGVVCLGRCLRRLLELQW